MRADNSGQNQLFISCQSAACSARHSLRPLTNHGIVWPTIPTELLHTQLSVLFGKPDKFLVLLLEIVFLLLKACKRFTSCQSSYSTLRDFEIILYKFVHAIYWSYCALLSNGIGQSVCLPAAISENNIQQ